MITLEQIIALENYVLLGRRASGETGVLEKFRAAKSVLDDAGLTKQADALSRGYDLADAILALARERLQAGTFQQGIEAAAKWHDEKVPALVKQNEEAAMHFELSGRSSDYGTIMGRTSTEISYHRNSATAIRNLKPEVGNG